MREIKFRQRNINNGQFHYWGFIDGEWINPVIQDNYVKPEESEQYTAIKDKNGKEIYEGDIVKVDNHNFEVFWDKEYVGFDFRMAEKLPYCLDMNEKYMEVIGNIYENKELLVQSG